MLVRMADMIADDPKQWGASKPIPKASDHHTLDDYHQLRDALFAVMSKAAASSTGVARSIFETADFHLKSTPKDGNEV